MEVNRLINYVDNEGKIIVNHLVNSYLINNENDLQILTNAKCAPGTRAYLADESKVWIFGADAQWHEVATSGGSGSSGDGLVIHFTDDDKFDKTWQEIYDAFMLGKNCVIVNEFNAEYSYITAISEVSPNGGAMYPFEVKTAEGGEYSTDSADNYPEWHEM